jgi:hypothetical protein
VNETFPLFDPFWLIDRWLWRAWLAPADAEAARAGALETPDPS